jgi:hypothetical protein
MDKVYKEITREEAIALKALGVDAEFSYGGVACVNCKRVLSLTFSGDMPPPKYRVQVDG